MELEHKLADANAAVLADPDGLEPARKLRGMYLASLARTRRGRGPLPV